MYLYNGVGGSCSEMMCVSMVVVMAGMIVMVNKVINRDDDICLDTSNCVFDGKRYDQISK